MHVLCVGLTAINKRLSCTCCVCDIAGRLYDKNGNLENWWANSSAQQFINLAQCFVDEYNQFSVAGYRVRLYSLFSRFNNNNVSYKADMTLRVQRTMSFS